MEVFNRISNDVSRFLKAGDLKIGFPYVFTAVRKVNTKFGMRVRKINNFECIKTGFYLLLISNFVMF